MSKARFILEKSKVVEQYDKLKELGVRVSYSYKTNREVGKVLAEETDSSFSIHNISEIEDFGENMRAKLWFFSQAWSTGDLGKIINKGVRNFVVDNEEDLDVLLKFIEEENIRVNLVLRMKFQEHRIHAGRYFTYGMPARKVNEIISRIKENMRIEKIGVHIHRKSQNASEWEIKHELEDSLNEESLKRINILNLGGGLPIKYRTYTSEVLPYIFDKIKEVKEWLESEKLSENVKDKSIDIYVEPGRFIAGPAVKLETEILQVFEGVAVVNTSIYNCALDTILTDIRMLVEGELGENEDVEGDWYKIKGNTPTRDDIFRHKVKLPAGKAKVGEKLVFLNAGAYNYTTDFCGLEKLETEIID